jgi:hypothetical protein
VGGGAARLKKFKADRQAKRYQKNLETSLAGTNGLADGETDGRVAVEARVLGRSSTYLVLVMLGMAMLLLRLRRGMGRLFLAS